MLRLIRSGVLAAWWGAAWLMVWVTSSWGRTIGAMAVLWAVTTAGILLWPR